MQLKGFIAGAAVVALTWLGSSAWDNYSAEMQARSTSSLASISAAAQGMSEAEKEAHVAEMRRMLEAHRDAGVCPYSGQGRARGSVVEPQQLPLGRHQAVVVQVRRQLLQPLPQRVRRGRGRLRFARRVEQPQLGFVAALLLFQPGQHSNRHVHLPARHCKVR